MKVSDLRQGDVLLFDTEDGVAIDDLIVLLTGSRATHAALYYNTTGIIADAYPPTIALHQISDLADGRTVWVRRHAQSALPMQPVTDAAARYVSAQEPYDMPGLVMLGLLLLYKHTHPLSTRTQQIVFQLLKRMAYQLDQVFAKGRHPMVCSEFVTQCFTDAATSTQNPGYQLQIEGGDLAIKTTSASLDMAAAFPAATEKRPSLLQRAAASKRASPGTLTSAHPDTSDLVASLSLDALVTLLLPALKDDLDNLLHDVPLDSKLVETIHSIADAFFRNAPAALAASNSDAISYLVDRASFFVTPGDLLSHCVNLTDLGNLKVHREEANWSPA